MALFDDNKKDGYQKYLATAFGKHVVAGHLIAHREEFVGQQGEKQFTLDLALADGASTDEDGEGAWDGIDLMLYGGREFVEGVDWNFHPGTLSTGTADPVQGEDPFFPGGGVYSGTVRLTLKLPAGIDFDASRLDIIARCVKCADYDSDGERTGISYTTNPARLKAFALKRAGKLSQIIWPAFVAARDYYEFLLTWLSGGTTPNYVDFTGVPEYETAGPIQIGAGGSASRTSGGGAFDNEARTKEVIPPETDGYFKVVVGTNPSNMIGLANNETGEAVFQVSCGNGHFGIFANSTPVDDALPPFDFPVASGDEIKLAVEGGFFKLYQNDVLKAVPQDPCPVPEDVTLRGEILLWASNTTVTSSEISGKQIGSTDPVEVQVKRFEIHPAFTAPTDLPTALSYFDSLCASITRIKGGKIEFLTPEARVSSGTLDDELNIDANSVRLFDKPPGERPTQLFALFRDTSDKYLREKPASDVREQLFDDLGIHTRVGPLNYASMPEAQAQRLIRHDMREQSDRKQHAECVGLASTYKYIVGDVITLLTRELDRVPKDFLILKATRDPSTGKRKFTLREYEPDDYRDSDQGHSQQAGSVTPPPSSTVAPPAAPVLKLAQVTDFGVGGTIITKVKGTIFFPIHPAPLRAKVFVIKPVAGEAGTVEEDAGVGLISPAAGTNQGTFEFPAESFGPYTFRVQVETATNSPVPGGSTSKEIDVGNVVLELDEPQNFTADVSIPEQVKLSWEDPATNPGRVSTYEVLADNEVTVVMPRQLVRTFTVQGVAAGTYTWKLRALDAMGNASDFVSETFTVDGASAGPAHALVFRFSGGGAELDPLTVPEAVVSKILWPCRIVEAYTKAVDDISGSCEIDLRKAPRSSAPPDAGDSIIGAGTKPGTSTGTEATLTDFSDWDTDELAANDEVRAVLMDNTDHEELELFVTVELI